MNTLEEKILNYKTPTKVKEILDGSNTVFLVGTAGAGKDTIMKRLIQTGEYKVIVSHTTRAPRENHGIMEIDGDDYHFVSQEKVMQMLDNNEFVEAKYAHGNVYGTSIADVEQAHLGGSIAINDIEVQGVAEYKAISDSVIPIFLLPPDFETWMQRLRQRYVGNVDEDDIKKRLNTAKTELMEALEKPYFEYVINDDLDKAVQIVDEISHGNFSTKKNEEARKIAQELLNKLTNYLDSLN